MSDSPAEARAASFAEHLRLIHLTLLAVCLAAMIAVTSTTPSYLDRSAEETKQLLDLKSQWQNGDWLEKYIGDRRSQIQSLIPTTPKKYLSYRSKSRVDLFLAPQPGQNRSAIRLSDGGSTDWLVLATAAGTEAHGLPKEELKFETIGDAQMVWNTLDRYRYVFILKNHGNGWITNGVGSLDDLTFISETPQEGTPDTDQIHLLRFYLRADLLAHLTSPKEASRDSAAVSQAITGDNSRCYLYGATARPPAARYVLRAECTSEPIDLQLGFVHGLLPPRPGQGDFAHSFPNVDDMARHLTELSLGDLQLFIAAEQKRSGEMVEILGAKLPQDAVAFWGTILLLAVTAYFWVVLRDFAGQGTASGTDSTVAWIGSSKNFVSRIAFLLTLVIPLSTGVVLAWNGMGAAVSLYGRACYGVAVCAIAALLVIIAWWHYKITRRESPPALPAEV